jgi:thiol-disulfide isomerase/thioredoxin
MKIKKIFTLIFLFSLLFLSFVSVKAVNQVKIYLFHDPLCLHCQDEEEFLNELKNDYGNIEIIMLDVTADVETRELFNKVKSVFKDEDALTPYTVIGGISLRGFNQQTKIDIENIVERYSESDFVDIVSKVMNDEEVLLSDFDTLERSTVRIPLIGEVEIANFSLLLGAIVIGFVDGFNPCAMWVLLLLITLLVNSNNKKRMWLLGVIFLFTSALVYFLIMMSWLQIAIQLTAIAWLRYLIGLFAVLFGGYNLIKYIKSLKIDDGCEVVDQKQKSKLVERVKKIIKQDSMFLAIIGIITLALTVNLIELACSAGLPLLYTQVLAYNDVSNFAYVGYVLVYVFFFLLDDLIIFSIAMVTLKVTGISTRYSKYSHLIGGVIMIIIGVLLVFFPNIIMFS